jgi:energy-coupling factor transport system ATP-binding protein
MDPILDIADYAYGYPEADLFVFRDIRMVIKPGECHCISGPTGIGKSTLLMAVQGLLSRGKEQGRIRLCGNGNRQASGLVFQNPNTQILTKSIGAEVAFGLENLNVAPEKMKPQVLNALKETGLKCPVDRDTRALSMGQKYRLILSSLIVMQPRLLMIDEPSGQLDAEGLIKLKHVLKRLKCSGMGLLISDHRPQLFSDVVDVFWQFDENGLLKRKAKSPEISTGDCRFRRDWKKGEAAVSVKNLSVGKDVGSVWSDVSFKIYPGETVGVCGKNGSGKTTLMRCLMGSVKPEFGEMRILGQTPIPENLRGRVGCLFQDPSRQLFEDSVFKEVAFQLRRAKDTQWKEKVHAALDVCGIKELSACSPHKLSYGQQHLVAMAMVIAGKPELLLLDDPFTGLDPEISKKIYYLLNCLKKENNTTVIVTTHHLEDVWRYDRQFFIRDGKIFEQ